MASDTASACDVHAEPLHRTTCQSLAARLADRPDGYARTTENMSISAICSRKKQADSRGTRSRYAPSKRASSASLRAEETG